jgi:hypothetical protein
MYSFFILGQIPGTGITISFTTWLVLAISLAAAIIWYKYATVRQKIRDYARWQVERFNDLTI